MLLSQRIAKNPNFLEPVLAYKGNKDTLNRIRLCIINSVKFIVGRELYSGNTCTHDHYMRFFGKIPTKGQDSTRNELYRKYCRLPFPSITIENDTGLLLLIANKNSSWDLYNINDAGLVAPGFFTIDYSTNDPKNEVLRTFLIPEHVLKAAIKVDDQAEWFQTLNNLLGVMVLTVFEILLFMNTRNVKQVKYVPTKKENDVVPKPLQPKYTYHILDLFKQKNAYKSLDDIKNDLCKPREATALRRAVIVRGHFKQRKTGLFFWDFHTRNKHNADVHGIVDKDYSIIDPSKLLTTTSLHK